MKFLFQANTVAEGGKIYSLKSILEEAGIPCLIRNENLSGALGEIPFTECSPELWVMNEQDYPRAKEIVIGWRAVPAGAQTSWLCPTCNETIEGQFSSCWKCGNEKA